MCRRGVSLLYSNVRVNKATTLQTIPLFSPSLPLVCFYWGDLQSQVVSVLVYWSSACDCPAWLSFLLCPWFSSVPGHPPRGRWVDVCREDEGTRIFLPRPARGAAPCCLRSLAALPCSLVEPQLSASSKRKYFLKSELSRSRQDVFSALLT